MINIQIQSLTSLADLNKSIDDTFEHDWLTFQEQFREAGLRTWIYIKEYINEHKTRTGGVSNLAESITFEDIAPAGTASVEIGIGNINILNQQAVYWHLINYGGLSLPAQVGMGVPGSFNGNAPDPSKSGTRGGTERWGQGNFMMFPKSPIEPMNYIEAAEMFLVQQMDTLLTSFK